MASTISLEENLRTVQVKGEFKCDSCDKSYKSSQNLSKHIDSIHKEIKRNCQGLKNFTCESCDKRFDNKSNLYSPH